MLRARKLAGSFIESHLEGAEMYHRTAPQLH
jgi:hypothetical protein